MTENETINRIEELLDIEKKYNILKNEFDSLVREYNSYHFDSDYWRGIKYSIECLDVIPENIKENNEEYTNSISKKEAYKIVLEDLKRNRMFVGVYDARTQEAANFMNGIWTLMETIAYRVSEETLENFDELFIKNIQESEKRARTKLKKEAKITLWEKIKRKIINKRK